MAEIHKASRRFFRNDDKAFNSLEDLHKALLGRDNSSNEFNQNFSKAEFVDKNDDVLLAVDDKEFSMNSWSFNQIGELISVPRVLLNRMIKADPNLAAKVMNFGKKTRYIPDKEKENKFYTYNTDSKKVVRAVTSSGYGRILDSKVVEITQKNIKDNVVPGGFIAGGGGNNNIQNNVTRTGLYASEQDVFLFLVNEDEKVEVRDEILNRGIIIWNSEVGSKTIGWMNFYYRYVCQNHIIWGASIESQTRRRHTKNVGQILEDLPAAISFLNDSNDKMNQEFEDLVQDAMEVRFATNEADAIVQLKRHGLTTKDSQSIVSFAKIDSDETFGCNPLSVWGIVQGITRFSQSKTRNLNDERLNLDSLSSKILNSITV